MQGESARIDSEELLAEAGWIRRLARGLVRDAWSSDDLAQDTWLAALRRPRASGVPLRPWLARVAANLTRDKGRADAARAHREQLSARSEREPSAADVVERLEAHRLLIEALTALPEPYRSTVSLRYLHGQSAAAIARRLKIPAGTVRWRLKHGLDELRSQLDQRFHGERGAWCLAFLPLIRRPPLVEIATSGASAAWNGVMVMNTMARIGVAAAVLVAGVGVWKALGSGAEVTTPAPEVAAPAEAAPPKKARAAEPAHESAPALGLGERASVAPAVSAPATAEAAAAPKTRLEARFVDAGSRPIAGVRLLVSLGERQSRSESGPDGRASQEFDLGSGSEVAWIEASAAGRATHYDTPSLRRGETTWLGDVVLEPGGAIEGVVLGPDRHPIEDAEVRATKPDLFSDPDDARRSGPGGGLGPHSRSSATGAFRIDGVRTGTPIRLWAGEDRMRWSFSAPIELASSEVKEGVELVLEPLAKEDTIEGIVLAPDGTPVADAEIGYSYRSRNQSGWSSTNARPDGGFRLRLTRVAPHDFHATDPLKRWPSVSALQVAPGTRDLELRFSEARTIELGVRAADGAPVERYRTELASVDRSHTLGSTKEEDHPGGRLSLAIPRDPFRLTVVARGFTPSNLDPIDPAEVGSGYEVRLERQPGLRGRVTANGQPVAGAKLELHKAAEERTTIEHDGFPSHLYPSADDETTSAADGTFQLDAKEKATVAVLCEAEGYALSETSPLDVDPRVGVDGIEIALGRGGSIEGRVILPPGKDPAGTIVAVDRCDARPRTKRVGPDGRFVFDRLTPGRWRVKRAAAEVRGGEGGTAINMGSEAPKYTSDCSVVEGEVTRFDLDLSDGRPCAIVAIVTANARPAIGWSATVWPASNLSTRELPGGAVDAEGRLRLEVPEPGDYTLHLRTPTEIGGNGTFYIQEMAVHRGENPLPLDLKVGRIEGRGAATSASSQLTYAWSDPSGVTFGSSIQVDGSGKWSVPYAPAGRGRLSRIVQGEDKSWHSAGSTNVDVPVGGTAEVDAP